MVMLERTNEGNNLILKEGETIRKTCEHCQKPLDPTHFFWCEDTKDVYCEKCITQRTTYTKENPIPCSRYEHTDWLIHKVIVEDVE